MTKKVIRVHYAYDNYIDAFALLEKNSSRMTIKEFEKERERCVCVYVCTSTRRVGEGSGVWQCIAGTEMKQCLRTVLFHGNNIVVLGSDV